MGVVASRTVRLRVLGLDTATLKGVTLVSTTYVQVLEVRDERFICCDGTAKRGFCCCMALAVFKTVTVLPRPEHSWTVHVRGVLLLHVPGSWEGGRGVKGGGGRRSSIQVGAFP